MGHHDSATVDPEVEKAYAEHDMDFVEAADVANASDSPNGTARLSKLHRDYLMERHGTLNLDPIPAMDPADPYNWPEWKVCTSHTAKISTIKEENHEY